MTAKTYPSAFVIECIDGRCYIGATAVEALDAMRAAAWGCPGRATRKAYMRAVAARVLILSKQHIRTESTDDFLDDMANAGMLAVRRTH